MDPGQIYDFEKLETLLYRLTNVMTDSSAGLATSPGRASARGWCGVCLCVWVGWGVEGLDFGCRE